MVEKQLPHLVVTSYDNDIFTSVSSGGRDQAPRPLRDRMAHSALLKQQLDVAWPTPFSR